MSNKLEKKFKTVQIAQIGEELIPRVSKLEQLQELLEGKSVGVNIFHVWLEDGQRVLYNGRIVKMKAKGSSCVASYWSQTEMYSDATRLFLSWQLFLFVMYLILFS